MCFNMKRKFHTSFSKVAHSLGVWLQLWIHQIYVPTHLTLWISPLILRYVVFFPNFACAFVGTCLFLPSASGNLKYSRVTTPLKFNLVWNVSFIKISHFRGCFGFGVLGNIASYLFFVLAKFAMPLKNQQNMIQQLDHLVKTQIWTRNTWHLSFDIIYLYRCYYWHPSKDSISSKCRIILKLTCS